MPASNSAQQFIAVDSIREDVVIMKDGGFRVVLMCSSLNFALKSADEQDAVIYQYQLFLNSLDFPVEFVIHSRRLNIQPYLETLRERQKDEVGELLQIQITEYIEFIKSFVDMSNIMSKTFYVAVPFTPAILEKAGFFNSFTASLGLGKKKEGAANGEDTFEEYKKQLWQRVDTVVGGIGRFGIRSAPLNTEELIELFYGLYNPTEFEQVARSEETVQAQSS